MEELRNTFKKLVQKTLIMEDSRLIFSQQSQKQRQDDNNNEEIKEKILEESQPEKSQDLLKNFE